MALYPGHASYSQRLQWSCSSRAPSCLKLCFDVFAERGVLVCSLPDENLELRKKLRILPMEIQANQCSIIAEKDLHRGHGRVKSQFEGIESQIFVKGGQHGRVQL